MKILFLSGRYPPVTKGGGEISTSEIAKALVDIEHTVTVATDGDAVNETIAGVKVVRRPFGIAGKPMFESFAAKRAAREVQKHITCSDFDVVHAHDYHSVLVLAELVKSGIVRVEQAASTARDYASISGDTNYILSDGTIPKNPMSVSSAWNSYRIAEASGLRKFARFLQYIVNTKYRNRSFSTILHRVYISHAQRRKITPFLRSAKHEQVIFNPVPVTDSYSPAKGLTVSYVGRIEEYKGVGVLLEAWKTIQGHVPQAHLLLVGDGAQRAKYELFVKQNDLAQVVEFRSFVPHEEISTIYDQSAVVVAPNIWIEPFGRVVAEAMAAGRVVVTTNEGGPKEMISNNQTGYLCKRGSRDDLALKLLEVLTMDPAQRDQIGVDARSWVAEHLSHERIGKQYEEFYLQMQRKPR